VLWLRFVLPPGGWPAIVTRQAVGSRGSIPVALWDGNGSSGALRYVTEYEVAFVFRSPALNLWGEAWHPFQRRREPCYIAFDLGVAAVGQKTGYEQPGQQAVVSDQ